MHTSSRWQFAVAFVLNDVDNGTNTIDAQNNIFPFFIF
jgi:hypothetical protein